MFYGKFQDFFNLLHFDYIRQKLKYLLNISMKLLNLDIKKNNKLPGEKLVILLHNIMRLKEKYK